MISRWSKSETTAEVRRIDHPRTRTGESLLGLGPELLLMLTKSFAGDKLTALFS